MIRPILALDREVVVHLLAATPGAAQWSAQDLIELKASGAELWVCMEAKQLAGVVAWREAGEEAEILNLAVAQAWRRKGIGRELMSTALKEAAEKGVQEVFLEVRESNVAARAFYMKLRFTETGRRRGYYRNPVEDALLFSLALKK
jgi:ribosomal-protein-alanine acetyltransferase